MADENRIEIEIVLDDGSIKKGFATLNQEAKKLGGNIEQGISLPSIAGKITKTIGIAVAAGAAIAGVIAKKSIDAAASYDEAVNRLNIALASTGQFSKEASEGFLAFADSIQKTTKFSDDQVLSSAALIQSIARLSTEGLERATKASLDLSAALGIDLDSASRLIAKAANGNAEALSRYGIQVQKGKTDTETFARALGELEKRFNGAAAASANTFAGSIAQAKNAFADIFKEIGKAITRSPAITALVKEITTVFSGVAGSIKEAIGGTDIFKDLIINFSVVAQAGIVTAQKIGDGFVLAFLRATQAWQAFKVATTLGLSDTFNDQLVQTNSEIDAILNKDYENSPLIKFFDDLIVRVSATSGKLTELSSQNTNQLAPSFDSVKVKIGDLNTAFAEGLWPSYDITGLKGQALADATVKTKETMVASFRQIGEQARSGFGSAVGSAFASFGKALASGENATKAFAKAFIGTIGGVLVQLGTSYILQGIAASANPLTPGIGGPLIAAGAALATFGGVLQALGGGGGVSSAGAGGGGAAAAGGAPITGQVAEQPDLEEKTTSVKIDVTGQVLNPIEVGNQLASILNDAFSAGGTKVVTA